MPIKDGRLREPFPMNEMGAVFRAHFVFCEHGPNITAPSRYACDLCRMTTVGTAPLEVRIINKGKHPLPAHATPLSAGVDLRANLETPLELAPGQRCLVPTGLFLELPPGTEAQVRPRSGLALKHGVTVLNAPGTIDADYRGEIGVLLVNLGQLPFTVQDGERVAQLVVAPYHHVRFSENADLRASERGTGGFGHTGLH